ncbi:hypothetical protein BABINDRAFT_6009 [Babjeviella inositovora NRRL Y-12698]|uniref:Uncharacterized protein n=1 Tax=Babjeviella inositovora NRRL Y-12698 TaxID=984486 RepID=A0A1E3QZV1_9ASCO|nr:uncharacterized protein BABINDRAFT_6009 [Babjeviella inositovora NRRL Y-12698]ODQ83151.1 hypothetical protein BABINDRAFT_6009 [Babjeviella inositovora NRRL Y-12698]
MSSLSSFSSFKSASTTSLCCSVSVLECDIDAHPLSYHESDDESASDDDALFDFLVFSPQPKLASEGSNTDLEFVKASTAAHQRVSKLSLSLLNGNRQGAVKSLSRSSSLSSASSRSLSTIETLESLVPQTKRPASPSSIVSSFLSQSFKKLSDAAAALTASQARQQLLVSAPLGTSPDHALLGFTPRMTDDRLPSIKLTTWKFDETPLLSPCCKPGDKGKKMRSRKNREPRVNSRFLRVYAHDRAAKRDGYLLVPEMNKLVIDMYINNTEDEKRELLHKLTEMSKEKLWSNVILQPRDDPLPPMPYDDDLKNRAPYQNKDIFMSKQSMVRPWGIRRGKTCVQYTVKGWANERWVPKGMSDMVDDDE